MKSVYKGKASYRHVYIHRSQGKYIIYVGKIQINRKVYSSYFDTEKEAALFVDMKLIELGKEPVNILKRK